MVVQIFFHRDCFYFSSLNLGNECQSMFYARVKNGQGQARITVTARLLGVVRTCVDKRSSIGGALLRRSKTNNQPSFTSKRAKYDSNCSIPSAWGSRFFSRHTLSSIPRVTF